MDISALQSVLSDLGVNLAANTVYDFLRSQFSSERKADLGTVQQRFESFLQVHGVSVSAATVISMLAKRGFLSIEGSFLYAPAQITMGAGPGAQFSSGKNSSSQTKNTAIKAVGHAYIKGSNAAIVQDSDGSISFFVGNDNN